MTDAADTVANAAVANAADADDTTDTDAYKLMMGTFLEYTLGTPPPSSPLKIWQKSIHNENNIFVSGGPYGEKTLYTGL